MGRKRVQRGVDQWLKTGENTLLINELPFLKKMWSELSGKEGDLRCGNDSYGYGDAEANRGTMEYISDRWFCAFRIKWIIDGLEMGEI